MASNAATATLTEFKIALEPVTLLAGTDTFTVVNAGTIGHEFVVRKTDLAADALPHKADGTVDESAPELIDVGEVEIPDAGATETLELALEPGRYVFFCNIPGHYVGGMHGSFTVVDPNAVASDASATLSEFAIDLEPTTLTAGSNTFTVANAGTIGHEFVVRKTDLAADALPQKDDGTVDESAPELIDVGEVEVPDAGATDSLTLELEPGNYVFFCNLPGHYVGGMRGSFTVEAAPSG
jgi:uncharacterized cupredoxin-like copper-binding protein